MPVLLSSRVVRVRVNCGTREFLDQFTNNAVVFPKADLRIEAGYFRGKINTAPEVVDLSNWVSATCTFKALGVGGKPPDGTADSLAEVTVLAADFNAEMTADQWSTLAGRHVAFDFSEAQINALPAGACWCVFTALLNTGKVVPLLYGQAATEEDGYGIADPAAVVDGTAFTKTEAMALFARDRNDITARTGGGAGNLDGIVTAAGAWVTGQSIRTRSGGGGAREEWILEAGNSAENAGAGIVRPDDYAPGTNERLWKQIL